MPSYLLKRKQEIVKNAASEDMIGVGVASQMASSFLQGQEEMFNLD